MHPATQNSDQTEPSTRLVVRLTKIGEPERVLEFNSGRDGVRVVGSGANADVVLSDPGVLPVHCYFERHYNELWLLPAQEGGELRVNYQPISSPVKLPERSIVEVGEARLQVAIVEREETSALHGPFGTEIIDISKRTHSDVGETVTVDVQAALDEVPTSHWQRPDPSASALVTADLPLVTPDEAVTLEYRVPPHAILEAARSSDEPTSAVQSASPECLTSTVRMPRAAKSAEGVRVRPTACIRVIAERGVASVPGEITLLSGTPCVSVASPVDRHCPTPVNDEYRREDSPSNTSRAENPAFNAVQFPGNYPSLSRSVQPELRAQPTRDRLRITATRRKRSFRLRLAMTLGRDLKTVAIVMIAAALSVSAFVTQAVRAWPYVATIAKGVNRQPTAHVAAARALATRLTVVPKSE